MRRIAQVLGRGSLAATMAIAVGCARKPEALGPAETFHWVRQAITFSPPSGRWYRQGDGEGGMLGVRFILTGGGGQCIGLYAHRQLAERDRRAAIARLSARRDSLTQNEFLREVSLVRAPTDLPLSDREAETSRAVNAALDRATSDYLANEPAFVQSDLEMALRAASAYEPTLTELLPNIRLRPERMQEPDRWRLGLERDTTRAGLPAFQSDDTLITPERPLLYHEVFWVVKGIAFKATYQGTAANLGTFERVVESVRFPEAASDGSR